MSFKEKTLLILMKSKARPFWVLSPMPQMLWDFPICLVGTWTAPSLVGVPGAVPANSLMWFLPWPCVDPYSAKYRKGTSTDLLVSVSAVLSSSSLMSPLALNLSPDTQLHLLISRGPWFCLGFPFLYIIWKLSRGLHLYLISQGSLVSIAWRPVSYLYILLVVLIVSGESKSSFCFSILAERRTLSWYIPMCCYPCKCMLLGEKCRGILCFVAWTERPMSTLSP